MLNTYLRKPLLILIVVCLINLTWSGCSEDNYGAVISANHEALAQILDQVCILTVEGIRACIHICNFVFIETVHQQNKHVNYDVKTIKNAHMISVEGVLNVCVIHVQLKCVMN